MCGQYGVEDQFNDNWLANIGRAYFFCDDAMIIDEGLTDEVNKVLAINCR